MPRAKPLAFSIVAPKVIAVAGVFRCARNYFFARAQTRLRSQWGERYFFTGSGMT
jgi:hypothetical protein